MGDVFLSAAPNSYPYEPTKSGLGHSVSPKPRLSCFCVVGSHCAWHICVDVGFHSSWARAHEWNCWVMWQLSESLRHWDTVPMSGIGILVPMSNTGVGVLICGVLSYLVFAWV